MKLFLILDQWFREKCRLKVFLYKLWQPFCSAERNHLCNFGRGYQKRQLCEIILNSGLWFRRCLLKDFLSAALVNLLFIGAEPFMQFRKRAS